MKLRVLSYNIHKGFSVFNRYFMAGHIKKMISKSESDLVFLQEVQELQDRIFTSDSGQKLESKLEFLADSLWPHFTYGKNAVYPNGHHGNAILSRHPVLQWDNTDLSLHDYEKRGLLHSIINVDGKSIHLFNTHINLLFKDRVEQAKMIADCIQERVLPSEPFILCGDFNDWTQTLTFFFSEQLHCHEVFWQSTGQHAKTFPSLLPVMCLDRVYYRNLNLKDCKVLTKDRHSDHLAIQADFEV